MQNKNKLVTPNDDGGGSGEDDFLCGVGSFHPHCLQRFSDRKLLVLFFSIMEISQAVFYSYFRSVITTLEKQFSVSTQTIAFVMAGKEISQILCGLVLAYYGGRGNRPRWISAGMFIVAISCILTVSPFFLLYDDHRELERISKSEHHLSSSSNENLCPPEVVNLTHTSISIKPHGSTDSRLESATIAALLLIFFGKFVGGVGINMLVTLTLPYLDDNMDKSASALYIAILTGLRVMGPTLGSLLGGLCLSIHVDLRDVGIDQDDPRWIGAWWLGYLVIGSVFLLGSAVVIWFPKSMNREDIKKWSKNSDKDGDRHTNIMKNIEDISNNNNKDVKSVTNTKGLSSSVKRLLTNKILMFNAASRCFTLFANNGFDTFQPKYIESYFQQTAASASFFSGLSNNAMRVIGIVAVGIVFRYWKPRVIYINAWNIFLDILFISSLLLLMSLKCPNVDFIGRNNVLQATTYPSSQLSSCVSNCSCTNVEFSPVCLDGTNYFSPCHAGCSASHRSSLTNKKMEFSNCSCGVDSIVDFKTSSDVKLSVASTGFCAYFCSALTMYLVIVGVQKTFMSTRKVGRTLTILRCIDEKDKSVALALTAIMESAFAYIPCPIVYGALLDSGCILWHGRTKSQGHCWLYDADHMRYVMHGLTAFFIAGATIFDCIMLYLCKDLSFFDDDVDNGDTKVSPTSPEVGMPTGNGIKNSINANNYSSHL